MLHDATIKLKKNKNHHEDNEINVHKNEFTHLFTLGGEEIKSIKNITEDIKVLVCSTDKNFKGIINSNKMVSFHDYKTVKK